MTFQHSNFKWIETFTIHTLHYSYFLQVFDDLYVAVGCSVVKKSIIAVVSFEVFLWVAEQIEESLVLMVSESYHQRSAPVVVWFWVVAIVYQNL
jgi:hypothetical protein